MGIEVIKLREKCHIISSLDLKQESILELQSQTLLGSAIKYIRSNGCNCSLGGPVCTQKKTFFTGQAVWPWNK